MGEKVNLIGINILIEESEVEAKSAGGIIMPEETKKTGDLVVGTVIQKGPGFLIPSQKQGNDIESILEGDGQMKMSFIPLDIEEGDKVYFKRHAADNIMLNGKDYLVIPYTAIKVFIRKIN